MKQEFGDYFLGFDVGTGSVGWAVTDESYTLQRFNGKDLWGVRLFETADTAMDRRLHRGARRRIERRRKRLALLQELFAEEISKKDPAFFQRLKDSAYRIEDKKEAQKHTIFNDANGFTDTEYHKKYPTIHHLIKAFIEGTAEDDIRLLYLACHNIIKKRGHFLFAGDSFDGGSKFNESISHFFEYIREDMGLDLNVLPDDMQRILQDHRLNPSDKQNELNSLCKLNAKHKQEKELIKLIVGMNYKCDVLYDDEELKETQPKETAFSKIDFDAKAVEFEALLGERFELILRAKAVYNCCVLSKILGENSKGYLSFAKVDTYEQHKEDLAHLKMLTKKYGSSDDYKRLFKSATEKNNYCAYIGMCKKVGRKVVIEKKCGVEDFYKYVKNILEKNEKAQQNIAFQTILTKMETFTFLPKQVDKKNSEVPYQLRKKELVEILNNAEKSFSFLSKKDEKEISVKEKIIMLLTFKIPYYIGLVNDTHKNRFSDRCWIVKKENAPKEKITPWNFYDIVDKEKTAEAFITSRTNKCSYLVGQDVLPKSSLLYSEYAVLNEINNLKISINGQNIFTVALKQKIFNCLFKKNKKVTQKTIEKFIKNAGLCNKNDTIVISGIDRECTSSLSSYIALKKIIGEEIEKYQVQKMLEDIILWSTIYDEGEGKDIIKAKIGVHYPQRLQKEQVEKILALKFSGWGRLSRKLLEQVICNFSHLQGRNTNIITALRETNFNFMELLAHGVGFIESIKSFNKQYDDSGIKNFSYANYVKDLYLSPSVKRMLWQTLRIANEIKKITKKEPKKIFIEMARGDETEKARTKPRKTVLTELYRNCKSNSNAWSVEINMLFQKIGGIDNIQLRSDKLYLYYTQLGKCMYCGKSINIDDVWNTHMYDIDHIYPQSKIKDDSLNNRVLVCAFCNKNKEDRYPIHAEIQNKQNSFWHFLHHKNFIETEKLSRLIRNSAISYDEIGGFIARQLVETRQATKVAGTILKSLFPDSTVCYVKAGNVSFFRKKFEIIKCREVNDFHHAHDAYLNIVVGNVYNVKFTNDPRNFIKECRNDDHYHSFNFYKVFDADVERHNAIGWKKEDTIMHVKKMLQRNTVLYTRHAYCQTGGLFDQTIMKKRKGQFPIKSFVPYNDIEHNTNINRGIEKYGAYNKVTQAYYILIEQIVKGEKIRTLEVIPVYLIVAIKKDKTVLKEYLKHLLKTDDFRIIVPKIKVNSLLRVNGFLCHITGKTNDRFELRSALQLFCDNDTMLFFKRLFKFKNMADPYKNKKTFSPYDDYSLRMYVKNSLLHKDKEINISEREFEVALKQKNASVYKMFVAKYEKSLYKNRLNTAVLPILKHGEDRFGSLLIGNQFEILSQVLLIFKAIKAPADLVDIGGKPKSGVMTISKKISSFEECLLINQSPTGVFENTFDLKHGKSIE